MRKVIHVLTDPDCEVIRPIYVDYNLIEVNLGQCWSIKERRFLCSPHFRRENRPCHTKSVCEVRVE